MLVFEERGKPEFPEKNLSEQSREPTNSAHIWRRVRESNPGHIGGRRALSPLHQPCSRINYYNLFCKQFDRNEHFSPFELRSAFESIQPVLIIKVIPW